VPDFCTCGAELPPDARFCHKCGKPQREELIVEEEVAPAVVETPPLPPPPPAHVPIGFRNPLALRVAVFTALVSLFLNLLVLLACPFWLTAAGFLGVYLYHRRTGEVLSLRNGAKLGWITGLIAFVFSSVPLVFVYVEQVTAPDYVSHLREQMTKFPFFPPGFEDQMIASVQTPAGIVTQVVILLVMLFVLFTLFPLLGGALGAKVLGKD
jgi:hypothetical protein